MAGSDRAARLPADAEAAVMAELDLVPEVRMTPADRYQFARNVVSAVRPHVAANAARQERQRICGKLSRYGLDNPDWLGVLEVVTDLIEEGT